MPIEILTFGRPVVFAETSVLRKTAALLGNRLEIPDSISTILEDGEHDVVFEGLGRELKIEVLVLNRVSALTATTPSGGERRVVRMPQETDAIIIAEESDGGNIKVHGFILSRR